MYNVIVPTFPKWNIYFSFRFLEIKVQILFRTFYLNILNNLLMHDSKFLPVTRCGKIKVNVI